MKGVFLLLLVLPYIYGKIYLVETTDQDKGGLETTDREEGLAIWIRHPSVNCVNGKVSDGEKWGIFSLDTCKSICLENPKCSAVVFPQGHLNQGYCGLRKLSNGVANCDNSADWDTYLIEGMEDAECITDAGKYIGAKCIFPFIYNGTEYNGCTSIDHTQPWCATVVDGNRRYVKDMWGNCASSCTLHGEGWCKDKPCGTYPCLFGPWRSEGICDDYGHCGPLWSCSPDFCTDKPCGAYPCVIGMIGNWLHEGICNGRGFCVSFDENPCAIHGCGGKSEGEECLMGDVSGICDKNGDCDLFHRG